MPPAVKSRLEDVVGLNSKSHKEFCDHVSHALEQYRKNRQAKKPRKRAPEKINSITTGRTDQKEQEKDSSFSKERRIGTNDSDGSSQCPTSSNSAKPSSPSKSTPDSCTCHQYLYSTARVNRMEKETSTRGTERKRQECAGDVGNLDITRMNVPQIHGNSHLGVEGERVGSSHTGVHLRAQ
ncbi:Rho guanine nucleotide exchange factor 17 [Labeo rohita]|uniref:Rho guanine nucleotide exchange factor 17 n=1 Tax=Labeo rohita TaxID=84645 RepID=A0ABQ8LKE4_LABRO|nr:Rho guanine nucleotide exchange factor 17 [Labeo rohita]